MNLPKLLHILRTSYDPDVEDRILNVYQFGSRIYGTATEDSDWDFIILVSKCYPYYKLNPLHHMTNEEKSTSRLHPERYGKWEIFGDGDRVNASFIDISDFKREVYYNSLEALQVYFIKPEHIWLEKVPLIERGFDLDQPLFSRQIWWELNRTTRVVKSKFRSGEYPRARKNYFFRFRFLSYGIQIAKTGRIHDFAEMNDILYEVRDMDGRDMNTFDLVYGAHFEEMWSEFINLMPAYKFYFKNRFMQVPSTPTTVCNFVSSDDNFSTYQQAGTLQTPNIIKVLGLEAFCRTYSMDYHTHPTFPELVFLKFDGDYKCLSKEKIVVARECNGLILDASSDWRVVSMPYYKIFSYQMKHCDEVDWSTAKVYEKFDGDLCVLFHHKGSWLVSSNDSIVGNNMLYRTDEKGPEVELLRNIDKLHRTAAYLFPSAQGKENPDTKTTRATGNNNNKNKNINRNNNNNNNITSSHNSFISTPSSSNPSTSNNNNNINTTSKRKALDEPGEHLLADVFWATWEKLNYQLPRSHTMVFMFELLVPACRHVVGTQSPRIILHGARDLETMKEVHHVEVGTSHKWETAMPISNLQGVGPNQLVELADDYNPFKREGFVVCDQQYNRANVKSKMHVSFSMLGFSSGVNKGVPNLEAQGFTPSRMLQLVRENKHAEFSVYFPRWQSELQNVDEKYKKFLQDVNKFMEENGSLPLKEFALVAEKTKYAPMYFGLRKRPNEKRKKYIDSVSLAHLGGMLGFEGGIFDID